MCENLLNNLVLGDVPILEFLKWLRNDKIPPEPVVLNRIVSFECSQSEFILYFLNYLHGETAGILNTDSKDDSPVKIKTPCHEGGDGKSATRLFSEKKSTDISNLGVSILDTSNNDSFASSTHFTSTPNKSHSTPNKSHNSTNNSFRDHLSPIHHNKSRNNSSLCLGDFLVKKAPTKKKHNQENSLNSTNLPKNPRRINPTQLNHTQRSITSDSFKKLAETTTPTTDHNSRDYLREERLKILSRTCPTIEPRVIRPSRTLISPELHLVTHKNQLEVLAQIYSNLIQFNLVLNKLTEIYFLLTLLLVQSETIDQNIEQLRHSLEKTNLYNTRAPAVSKLNPFKSVHNCVYFAAFVLKFHAAFFAYLDRATLKLLHENQRLRIFAPNLTQELLQLYDGKKPKIVDYLPAVNHGNVTFISETDNRENFTTVAGFCAFRKQRDLFYIILEQWDLNHLQSGWSFNVVLFSKIRTLLTLHADPVNLAHLARLFKNQLLSESVPNDDGPIPAALQNCDSGKLSRLRDRFISRNSHGGPSPQPAFPGRQDFFKEFILTARSFEFFKHLSDCFIAEILQLDETVIAGMEDEDGDETELDLVKKSLYVQCLRSLKILGKFLGFLDALPYQTDVVPTYKVLSNQIAIRKYTCSSIDITERLHIAIKYGRLSLTIPWITEYLAMLDHTTLRLPYFQPIIETLYNLHYEPTIKQSLIIQLTLGWLFERPNFPLDSYQLWLYSKIQQQHQQAAQINTSPKPPPQTNSIDQFNLIDEHILYTCCPYLIEIKNCLNSDQNSGSCKYIRPVTTDTGPGTKKNLETHLEEAFFHGQPTSLKKTVDLVTERIASAFVKNICNLFVPPTKLRVLEQFRTHLEHIYKETDGLKPEIMICCKNVAKDLSQTAFEDLKHNLQSEIGAFCAERCAKSIHALLPDDVHLTTKETCISITTKQTKEKINKWFAAHVDSGIFYKELNSEMEIVKHNKKGKNGGVKKPVYHLPLMGRNLEHDPNAFSPVVMMTNIRAFIYTVFEKPETLTGTTIEKLLSDATETCSKRCDLNAVAQNYICKMFIDLFLLLACKRPDLTIIPHLQNEFIAFWLKFLPADQQSTEFGRILSIRNFVMFEQSVAPEQTWHTCRTFLAALLRDRLLSPELFEQQAVAMFRYEMKTDTMKHYTECLQVIVDSVNGEMRNKFGLIISWLADFCNDEQFF